MFKARNGCVKLPDMEMDFISFGSGNKNLIMIPGLGDGLKTVKGLALPFAFMYRCFASKYKYMYSAVKIICLLMNQQAAWRRI